MSFSQWDIGGCACVTTCDVTFFAQGCASGTVGVQGVTVNIWTNSSKTTLVATGDTDSTGHVTIDVGSTGTYFREVVTNTARWVKPADATITISTCGSGTFNLPLSLGTGYVSCINGCQFPAKGTLTDGGSNILTWGGASWGSLAFTLAPNLTCTSHNPPCSVTLNSCPPSFSVTITDALNVITFTE